jgi:phage shock protein E
VTPKTLADRLRHPNPPIVLDVRTPAEYASGHVPGAINIPFDEIGTRVHEIPDEARKELVVYCGHGPRAWIAGARLRRRGFAGVVYLRGHWKAWQREGR